MKKSEDPVEWISSDFGYILLPITSVMESRAYIKEFDTNARNGSERSHLCS
jgi:hypothetical protein